MRTQQVNLATLISLSALTALGALTLLAACGDKGAGSPTSVAASTSAPLPAASASRPAASTALTTLSASASASASTAKLNFALVSGPCVQASCAAALELVREGQRLDSAPLEFAASSAKLEAQPAQTLFGSKTALPIWTSGDGEGAVSTAVQTVRLSADRVGLLVHQSAGFEHVKVRRDLFVADGDTLKKVWSKADGQGPVRSYVDVVPRGASTSAATDEIVMIEGMTAAPNEADRIVATRLTWDESTKTLSESPVESLPVVVAATFATAERARSKFVDTCYGNYWVIREDGIGGAKSRFALAMVASDAVAATREMNQKCDGDAPSVSASSDKAKPARRIAQFKPATTLF